ncbi:DUF2142 domain-containing protein [Acidisoma cellulosilytica]|uniref:DUF2142 domain-containing protein n=1 Tax=Acidisoma cellulosilyticum TaxID=2802395 RepID=A0A963Z006_9PROT|nr:DUF2142 domain-containing protein [Acidisoma cellulosilyticum]MCB8880206.1 DUF2142 domain-containing protein [Acidisoma cellulosilyticum]
MLYTSVSIACIAWAASVTWRKNPKLSFLRLNLNHFGSLFRGLRQEAAPLTLIPVLFAIFFSVMMVCGCVIAPPFQTPDEYAHFMRNVQISEGHIVGSKGGKASGGKLPASVVQVTSLFGYLPGDSTRKANLAEIERFDTITWVGPPVFADFRNTVLYGPILYLPAATAIWVTRHLNWTVLQSYYMGRFANALVFMILGILALAIARRGRVLICFILSLPMSAALAMSVSQDAQMIALGAVLAAILTNHRQSDPWSWLEWGLVGLGFGVLGMAKAPYVALSAIPCLLAGRREFVPSLICPLVALILTFAWLKIGVAPTRVHFAGDAGVVEATQALFIAHHPIEFVGIVIHSISSFWTIYTEQFTGALGWLQILLPQNYYDFTRKSLEWLILGGIVLRIVGEVFKGNYWFVVRALLIIALMLLSVFGIFLSLYIIWTVVAAPLVNGIQGRYFLPMTFFLAVLMPNLRDIDLPIVRTVIGRSSALLCAGWMGWAGFVFFQAILVHYWFP